MTQDEKQAELDKNKIIVDACLNHLLRYHTGNIIYDDVDPQKRHYESQKAEAKTYFNTGNFEKLEHQLGELTRILQHTPTPNVDFTSYLKEHTGYDLDILAEYRKSYEKVLAKGKIETQTEGNNFCIMLSHLGVDEKEMQESYAPMLNDFHQREMAAIEASPERKKEYDELHELVEENGEIVEIFYYGGKPYHHKSRDVLSPNGKFILNIKETAHHDHSSTGIQLDVENHGCSLFSVEGVHPEINAFWKDNQTIIIENHGYQSYSMYRKIEICGHVFHIEYIEN